MKHMMIAGLLILSSAAHAKNKATIAPQHLVLCEIGMYEEDLKNPQLQQINSLDINDLTSLPNKILDLVNQHLIEREYTPKALSFAEIKELFSTGDEAYNDLYIITYEAKHTGAKYLEVKTFPGDNPYSLIFNEQGKLVANTQDGSVSLKVGPGNSQTDYFHCPY